MADRNGYIGRAPGDSAVIIASQTFEPTGIQTDFTFAAGYTVGYLDVYFNGARLIYANDYVAANGTTVGLTTYANNGDVLELVSYNAFNVGNVQNANCNFSVCNQLTVSGVTTATSAYYTGIVTASSFYGDGSTLTGVANTDNIITGTAVTITGAANAVTLNVSGITTVGILTVFDTTQSTSASTGGLVIHGGVGIAKSLFVDGNVTIGGTLTYEDMTNTDNLGFGTFRKGIEVQGAGSTTTTLNITGLSTAQGGIEFGASGVGGTVTALGHAEFVGIVTASGLDAAIAFWTLGASGTDHYTFTGPGDLSAENDPDLQLIRGQKYIFKNRSGGHPFRIQSTVNGSTGTAYNDGVTNNDGGNGTDIIFDVPFDAPAVLYYQCTSHGAMGGVIYIGSSSGDDVNVGVGATIHASSGNAVFAGIVTATTLKYGTTSVETAIDAKASTGKAIAMAMVFGF